MKWDDMEFAKHRSGIKRPRFHISKTVVIATICASLLLLNIYFIHADYSAKVTFLKHFSLYKAALAESKYARYDKIIWISIYTYQLVLLTAS